VNLNQVVLLEFLINNFDFVYMVLYNNCVARHALRLRSVGC
jgi:hypothetical protein